MINMVSFILRGRLRRRVVLALDEPKTPTMLGKTIKAHRSGISRVLRELREAGLAVCLNPEDQFVRFYALTEYGEQLQQEVRQVIVHKYPDQYSREREA